MATTCGSSICGLPVWGIGAPCDRRCAPQMHAAQQHECDRQASKDAALRPATLGSKPWRRTQWQVALPAPQTTAGLTISAPPLPISKAVGHRIGRTAAAAPAHGEHTDVVQVTAMATRDAFCKAGCTHGTQHCCYQPHLLCAAAVQQAQPGDARLRRRQLRRVAAAACRRCAHSGHVLGALGRPRGRATAPPRQRCPINRGFQRGSKLQIKKHCVHLRSLTAGANSRMADAHPAPAAGHLAPPPPRSPRRLVLSTLCSHLI